MDSHMTMSCSFRRLVRLFYCLISAITLLVLPARGAEINKTVVSDTIYRADGNPAKGTLLISWPAFSSADGKPVAAGTLSVKIAANGSVNIPLVPTQGANPSGTAYKVVISLDELKAHMRYLVGTGNDGRVHELAERVARHERYIQRAGGIAAGLAGLMTLIHVAIDYLRLHFSR